MHDFLKNEDLDVRFSKKSGPRSEKYGPLPKKWGPLHMIFWKKGDLNLNKWTFYAWISEKWGPLCVIFWKKVYLENEKCVHLRMVFWKKGTSTWKMWTFTRHFLKKMDLYQKNVDLYAWVSEKSGPRPVNVDLLRMIFWNMWTFMHVPFSEKSGPRLEKCGPLCLIFWKKVDLNLENVDFYASFSEESGPLPALEKWTR